MSDDLVERLSAEAKIWPRSDISGLLRESVTEIERLRAEVEGLRARIEGAAVGFWCEAMPAYICLPKNWLEVVKPWTDGKRVALVVVDD